jgi:elongation factor 1-alpha
MLDLRDLENPHTPTQSFLGEVVLLEGTLKRGDRLEMKCGTNKTVCLVKEIRERISSETGEVMGINSEQISENEAATVIFETDPMVVEEFSEIPELGRFVLVRGGRNVGAGVIFEAHA